MMETKTKFKQTEIGSIPEEWEVKKVNQVTDQIFSGGTPNTRKSEYWNGNIPWLSSGETSNTFIFETERKITESGVKNSSTRLANVGDIVVASAGQGYTRGQVSFCMIDTFINQSVVALRANKDILKPRFLFYNLVSRYNELRRISDAHSSRGSLTTKLLADLNIQIPPISEQTVIAKILSDLDLKIALNRSMNSTLEAIGQALFKRWFIDFEFPNEEGKPYRSSRGEMVETELGEVPAGWKVVSFDEIVEVRGGSTPKTENPAYWNGNIPWITPKDLTTSERIHFSKTSRYITQAGLESISKNLLPVSTILLSSRAPIGYVAINDVQMATNQGFINIICSDKINNLFLYYWLKFNKELLLSFANGTTFQELSKSSFKKIKLILPHQTQMNLFKAIISPLDLQIANNHDEIEKISLIRDALLPKLMSGEIRVSNEKIADHTSRFFLKS